jgi:DNA adenine methylase
VISKETRKKRARPLVRWHGGKWMIAPFILRYLPPHETYVEPFGGGASILLRKERATKAEIYNDLDETLIRLFKVLQDPAKAARLLQLLEVTPYSRREFDWSYNCTGCEKPANLGHHERCKLDDVEEVRRTLVRSWMGYGSDGTAGAYRTGFRSIVNHAGKTPAGEWVNYLATLPRTIERIRGVNIECRDAFKCAEQYDGPESLFYFDPPYLPETRSTGNRRRGAGYHVYQHELSTADHEKLLDFVCKLEGMVILSGYPSPLYQQRLASWPRHQRQAYADGAMPRTEVIWINPRCAKRLKDVASRNDTAPPLPLLLEGTHG